MFSCAGMILELRQGFSAQPVGLRTRKGQQCRHGLAWQIVCQRGLGAEQSAGRRCVGLSLARKKSDRGTRKAQIEKAARKGVSRILGKPGLRGLGLAQGKLHEGRVGATRREQFQNIQSSLLSGILPVMFGDSVQSTESTGKIPGKCLCQCLRAAQPRSKVSITLLGRVSCSKFGYMRSDGSVPPELAIHQIDQCFG